MYICNEHCQTDENLSRWKYNKLDEMTAYKSNHKSLDLTYMTLTAIFMIMSSVLQELSN